MQIIISIIVHLQKQLPMRTEEETKFNLNEKIFELYDNGLSIESIAGQLGTSSEYIQKLFSTAPMESA